MESLFFECFITLLLGIICGEVSSTGEVVYAVNSGGPAHTDLNGVHFQADKLTVGTASDFGKSLSIGRVAPADQILYQTERYHFSNFGYSIPIKENGDYVLILKFCEVYFQGPRLKVRRLEIFDPRADSLAIQIRCFISGDAPFLSHSIFLFLVVVLFVGLLLIS